MNKLKRLGYYALFFFVGACLSLAFKPVGWTLFSFLCPAFLLFGWLKAPLSKALWQGFWFGCGLFASGVSWVFVSIYRFGGGDFWISLATTALFAGALALFFVAFAACFYCLSRHKPTWVRCLVIFPVLWIAFEWLRSSLFTGFPWLLLGTAQSDNYLTLLAPIFSVYGISLFVAYIAGLCVYWLHCNTSSQKNTVAVIFVLSFAIVLLLSPIQWTQPIGKPIRAALIQGNIPQSMKWDVTQQSIILKTYTDATKTLWSTEQLIIWPEAAIPELNTNVQPLLYWLNDNAKKHKAALLVGIPTEDSSSQDYNSLLALGDAVGQYNKEHLVPFGEYTPLPSLFMPLMREFNFPMSNFVNGNADQELIQFKNLNIAGLICYEVAFPDLIRNKRDANLFVSVSDDSWFGDSFAKAQQLQMAQLRAAEMQKPLLYATNTGITAFINEKGKVTSSLPENQFGVLKVSVQPRAGNTWMALSHNAIVWVLCGLLLMLTFLVTIQPTDKNQQ